MYSGRATTATDESRVGVGLRIRAKMCIGCDLGAAESLRLQEGSGEECVVCGSEKGVRETQPETGKANTKN